MGGGDQEGQRGSPFQWRASLLQDGGRGRPRVQATQPVSPWQRSWQQAQSSALVSPSLPLCFLSSPVSSPSPYPQLSPAQPIPAPAPAPARGRGRAPPAAGAPDLLDLLLLASPCPTNDITTNTASLSLSLSVCVSVSVPARPSVCISLTPGASSPTRLAGWLTYRVTWPIAAGRAAAAAAAAAVLEKLLRQRETVTISRILNPPSDPALHS